MPVFLALAGSPFVTNLWQKSANKMIVNYIGVVYNALVHRISYRRRDETEKGCILRSISKTAWKTGRCVDNLILYATSRKKD